MQKRGERAVAGDELVSAEFLLPSPNGSPWVLACAMRVEEIPISSDQVVLAGLDSDELIHRPAGCLRVLDQILVSQKEGIGCSGFVDGLQLGQRLIQHFQRVGAGVLPKGL